ncbi:hypothetical protein V6Z11_D13G112100 [Gossypium hirsutum]
MLKNAIDFTVFFKRGAFLFTSKLIHSFNKG